MEGFGSTKKKETNCSDEDSANDSIISPSIAAMMTTNHHDHHRRRLPLKKRTLRKDDDERSGSDQEEMMPPPPAKLRRLVASGWKPTTSTVDDWKELTLSEPTTGPFYYDEYYAKRKILCSSFEQQLGTVVSTKKLESNVHQQLPLVMAQDNEGNNDDINQDKPSASLKECDTFEPQPPLLPLIPPPNLKRNETNFPDIMDFELQELFHDGSHHTTSIPVDTTTESFDLEDAFDLELMKVEDESSSPQESSTTRCAAALLPSITPSPTFMMMIQPPSPRSPTTLGVPRRSPSNKKKVEYESTHRGFVAPYFDMQHSSFSAFEPPN